MLTYITNIDKKNIFVSFGRKYQFVQQFRSIIRLLETSRRFQKQIYARTRSKTLAHEHMISVYSMPMSSKIQFFFCLVLFASN